MGKRSPSSSPERLAPGRDVKSKKKDRDKDRDRRDKDKDRDRGRRDSSRDRLGRDLVDKRHDRDRDRDRHIDARDKDKDRSGGHRDARDRSRDLGHRGGDKERSSRRSRSRSAEKDKERDRKRARGGGGHSPDGKDKGGGGGSGRRDAMGRALDGGGPGASSAKGLTAEEAAKKRREEEHDALEAQMEERRRRVEEWRRKKMTQEGGDPEAGGGDADGAAADGAGADGVADDEQHGKGWSLEDDADSDDEDLAALRAQAVAASRARSGGALAGDEPVDGDAEMADANGAPDTAADAAAAASSAPAPAAEGSTQAGPGAGARAGAGAAAASAAAAAAGGGAASGSAGAGAAGGGGGDRDDDDVDPLDAFMVSNKTQLVRDWEQMPAGHSADEVDPLDAFMSGQVLPQMHADLAVMGTPHAASPSPAPASYAAAAAAAAAAGASATPEPSAAATPVPGAGETAAVAKKGPTVIIRLKPMGGRRMLPAKMAPAGGGGGDAGAGVGVSSQGASAAAPAAAAGAAGRGVGAARKVPAGQGGKKPKKGGLNYARYESSSDSSSEEADSSEEEDDAAWAKAVNAGKMSKGDRLGLIDHATMEYPEFRKNFYIEVPELARMSEEDLAKARKDDGIKVRGVDVPKPIRSWTQCGMSGKLLDILKKGGCETPLPIQAQALPIIMSGRDCIGIAKTGSGKTLAFVLPMMRHVKDQPPIANGDGPIGLLMAPTRELVQQIAKEIKKFGKPLGLTVVAVFGGSGVANQISDLKRGTEMVVCTPGRMIDLLTTSNGKITNLRRCTYFVLDEADRMFDMGFEPQIMRIVQNIRPDRQTVMFSATFPRQVETLARKILIEPIEIQVGGRSVVNADIEQIIEIRPEADRFLRLLEVLGEWYGNGKIIIFVQSQEKCDNLFRDLLNYGYPCLSLHGGKDQTDREGTVSDFKGDVCNILVATSIAARGLDVKDLVLVLNYDAPNHHEDYVHRVGRTGRAGNKGTAITFIGPEEEQYAPDLCKALKESGAQIPQDLQALADAHHEKRRTGQVQGHGSGFGGTGHKFDKSEEDAHKALRKSKAKDMGLEVEDGKAGGSDSDDDAGIRKVDGTGASVAVGGVPGKPGAPAHAGAAGISNQGFTISADAMAAMARAGAAATAAAAAAAMPPQGWAGQPLSAGMQMSALPSDPQAQAQILAAQAVAARLMGGAPPAGAAWQPGQPGMGIAPGGGPTNVSSAMLQGLSSIPGVSLAPGAFGGVGMASVPMMPGGVPVNSVLAAAQRAAVFVGGAQAPSGTTSTTHRAAVHYEAELEVNDFPQHARWKVTHRDMIGHIADLTGCALITKGVFVPPGRPVPEGERKIYLLIEGKTEGAVKKAKQELKRVVEEATEKVMRRDTPAAGRYVV